jgi:hypothetical protein
MNQPSEPHSPGNPDHQSDLQPYTPPPPPEKGFPRWVLGLIGCGWVLSILLGAGIVVVAFFTVIISITSGTQDPSQSEGAMLMGSLRNWARVAYEQTGTPPHTLTGSLEEGGAGVEPDRLQGRYYQVEDRISTPRQGYGSLTASPTPDYSRNPTGTITFSWDTGESEYEWSR